MVTVSIAKSKISPVSDFRTAYEKVVKLFLHVLHASLDSPLSW